MVCWLPYVSTFDTLEHGGSIVWKNYRQRWLLLANEIEISGCSGFFKGGFLW